MDSTALTNPRFGIFGKIQNLPWMMILSTALLLGISETNCLLAQELPVVNGFAAKVNGKVITLAELNQAIERSVAGARGRFPKEQIEKEKLLLRPLMLERLIERQLLLQKATQEEIFLPPGTVENYLQREVDRFSNAEGTKYSIDDYLAIWQQQFGETEGELRTRLEEELRIDELKKKLIKSTRSISPKELREYYRNHTSEFTEVGRLSFRQLLIATNDPDHSKILNEIDSALDKTSDFETLITTWSMGPRQEIGGLYDMSETDLDARFSPVPEVVRSLKVGEISDWFQCRGYSHKIQLLDRVAGGPLDFSKAQNQIRQIIVQKLEMEKQLEFQQSIWRDTSIEILIPGIEIPQLMRE
ncbi:MAG: SurA N-terminal domain-containing protein [Planctomycetota bacterium]